MATILEEPLTEAQKQQLIEDAQRDIDQLYKDFNNPKSTLLKVFGTENKEIINYWAQRLEVIYRLQNRPINTIANFITKELQRFKLVDEGYTYAYDVLPACYKSHTKNPEDPFSVHPSQIGSYIPANGDCLKENAAIIKRLEVSGHILLNYAKKLANTHLLSLLNEEEMKIYSEHFLNWDACNERAADIADGRVNVPGNMIGLFYKCLAKFTENDTASMFFRYARKVLEISSKQAHKLAYGLTRNVPDICNPESFEEAIRDGFYGSQCRNPKCGAWRMERRVKWDRNTDQWDDKLYCYACDQVSPIIKLRLPGPMDREKRTKEMPAKFTMAASELIGKTTVNVKVED